MRRMAGCISDRGHRGRTHRIVLWTYLIAKRCFRRSRARCLFLFLSLSVPFFYLARRQSDLRRGSITTLRVEDRNSTERNRLRFRRSNNVRGARESPGRQGNEIIITRTDLYGGVCPPRTFYARRNPEDQGKSHPGAPLIATTSSSHPPPPPLLLPPRGKRRDSRPACEALALTCAS